MQIRGFLKNTSLLIFAATLTLFSVALRPEFQGMDARFALFAQEMLRNGPTFFPTTYGAPYPDYPATSTFFVYLFSFPFGRVTPLSAVLPSAIASALILVVIYRIGALHSREWGLWAMMLALCTKGFFSYSRSISPDQYVSLVTVSCFYFVYASRLKKRKENLFLILFLMLVGFAFRGPLGLIIPAGVLCGFYLLEGEFKKLFLLGGGALLLLVLASGALLAAAAYQGGEEFVKRVITMEAAGRLTTASHGPDYYWVKGLVKYALGYPLALIVLLGAGRDLFKGGREEKRLLRHLALWIVIVLGGLSIPGVKKMRYILPAVPAFALCGAGLFVNPVPNRFLRKVRSGFLRVFRLFPWGAGLFCLAALLFRERWGFDFVPHGISALAIMTILIAVSEIGIPRLQKHTAREPARMAVTTLSVLTLIVCYSSPAYYYRLKSGPFIQAVFRQIAQQEAGLAFYRIPADGEAVTFAANFKKPIHPRFFTSPDELSGLNSLLGIIIKEEEFSRLPEKIRRHFRIIVRGRLEKEKCLLIMQKNFEFDLP